jgi:lipopolysaccharide export system protein LptA
MSIGRSRTGTRAAMGLAAALAAALACGSARAQEAGDKARGEARLPQAFSGLGVSSDDPIQFEAEALEVREQDRTAIFTGNVVVRQNETVLKTARLTVTYAGENTGGAQQVERLEADGSVLVTSGPQTASGDKAVFDTAANTIVVTGNVVLTQGNNVIRGASLTIDIASGQARMGGGRVQMLIEPRSLQERSGNGG